MKNTTWLGLIIGIGGILFGNVLEGGHTASLIQGAAAVIVLTGTLGAVLVSNQRQDFKLGWGLAKRIFKSEGSERSQKMMNDLIEATRIARKDSILSLEGSLGKWTDPFMKDVMKGVIDGFDVPTMRSIFENEITAKEHRLNAAAKIWTDAGGYAPTIGIIGAVLGLIHVMGNLSDTSKLGAGIATAFVATIYGVGFANLIFLPMGNKIKKLIQEEIKTDEMVLEGAIGIISGLNPSVMQLKLRSFVEKESR